MGQEELQRVLEHTVSQPKSQPRDTGSQGRAGLQVKALRTTTVLILKALGLK